MSLTWHATLSPPSTPRYRIHTTTPIIPVSCMLCGTAISSSVSSGGPSSADLLNEALPQLSVASTRGSCVHHGWTLDDVRCAGLALADAETLESTAHPPAGVFNGLPFAFQLRFRLLAVDLEDHAAEAELAAARRDPELAGAGRDYAAL